MICSACRTENEAGAPQCVSCAEPLQAMPELTPGKVIAGRYELRSQLGSGGMGVVLEAHDQTLDELVALKVLKVSPASGRALSARESVLVQRFRSEIKLARKVHHPNVCGIHEYGEEGTLFYISMELVVGQDLKGMLRERGPLPWEEAYDIAIQITEGLGAIHDVGIIHRDLKPANCMRDERGRIRLMDFGIAKLWSEEGTPDLTAAGRIVGSPTYMSPEQVRSQDLDFRSDLYSLGLVIWKLFTGRAPFEAATPVATMLQHLQKEPPFDEAAASRLPRALVPILRRLLSKDPHDRHAGASELGEDLREAREQLDTGETDAVIGADPLPLGLPPLGGRSVEGGGVPLPPEASLLVPHVASALRHPEESVRARAVDALSSHDSLPDRVIAELRGLLSDESWQVRARTVAALGRINASAGQLDPGLVGFDDTDQRVRAVVDRLRARLSNDAEPVAAPSLPEPSEAAPSGDDGGGNETGPTRAVRARGVRPELAAAPGSPKPSPLLPVPRSGNPDASPSFAARGEAAPRPSSAAPLPPSARPPASEKPRDSPAPAERSPTASANPDTPIGRVPLFDVRERGSGWRIPLLSAGGALVVAAGVWVLVGGSERPATPGGSEAADASLPGHSRVPPARPPITSAPAADSLDAPEPGPPSALSGRGGPPAATPELEPVRDQPSEARPPTAPPTVAPLPQPAEPTAEPTEQEAKEGSEPAASLTPLVSVPAEAGPDRARGLPSPPGTPPPAVLPPPTPVPAPARGTLVELSDPEVTPPRLIEDPALEYPPLARRLGTEGTVELRALISENGRVLEVVIDKSVDLLDAAAEAAVRARVYQPALKRGVAVRVWLPVSVRFELKG